MDSRRTLDTSAKAQAAILEQMHCSVIATDLEGRIVYWNRFAEQQFQWTADMVMGRPYAEVLVPAEAKKGVEGVLDAIRKHGHLEMEGPLLRRDGSTFQGRTVSTTLCSPEGEVIGHIGVTSDVSEQRETEQQLRQSEERFRSLAAHAPLMIWMTNPAGEIEYVNARFTEISGVSAEGPIHDEWASTIHGDDREEVMAAYTAVLDDQRGEVNVEYRVRDVRTGDWVWILGTAVPRTSESGDFAGLVGYGLDITERRRQQESRSEDAAIASALARVGQELISSLNHPDFLDRLCALTAEHLNCVTSQTLLLRDEEDAFELIAGTYTTPEQREAAQGLYVPRKTMARLLENLRDTDVATVGSVPESFLANNPDLASTRRVCLALRHGDELIGIQTAQRHDRKPLSPAETAIGRGIAQLASLALGHARLVDELERANRVKSDFVATMSHELRTPLHVILGYTDLLLSGEFGPLSADQVDTASRIDRRAHELHDLITNTLDVSRLDSGRVRLHIEDVSVPALVADIDLETQRLQEDSGLRLSVEIPEGLPPLRSDPMKLKVVLKNLVSNALKFTPEGSVHVRGQADELGVEIRVEDTGIGIDPAQIGTIFEPFRQVDGSASRRHAGVGLGLYIVHRLVELLGGSITVESALGQGSTFRVRLPLRLDRVAA